MAYEISLSKKVDKNNKSEIKLRLRLGKIQQKANTRLYICPKFVYTEMYISKGRKCERLIIKTPRFKTEEVKQADDVKEKLDNLIKHIEEKLQETSLEQIGSDWLKEQIDIYHDPHKKDVIEEVEEDEKLQKKPEDFFDIYDEFTKVSPTGVSTHRRYAVIKRTLQRFELYKQIRNKGFKIKLEDIDEKFLREFEKYINEEYKILQKHKSIIKQVPESRTPDQRGQNTINAYFKKFRTFFLWCNMNDYTNNDPFKKYKIGADVYGTPYYITVDERHQIENADLSRRPELAIQRDIFVFQCCIGCRVSDLRSLTIKNIIDGELNYIARKTKLGNPVTIKVPLNKTAMAIVEKYKDENRKSLLPFISDQKYNDDIKKVFKLAGVTRNVVVRNPLTGEEEIRPINEVASSHMARRTFIGNIYKKVKDQNLVSELSGHVPGSRAFARYREIDRDMKQDMVNILD